VLEGINIRISEAEERISELEDKMVEIISEEHNKVKRIKRTNIGIIGLPEEEEKKKEYEKTIFEDIVVETFPNMEKEIVNQVQDAQKVPYRKNQRRNMPGNILTN